MVRQALLVSLLFACWACAPKTQPAPADDKVEITGVHLFTDDNGKAGAEVSQFDYRQKTLFFGASLNKTIEDKKGKWIFTAKKTAVGNDQAIQALEGTFKGNAMTAQIHLNDRPWPVGTYHVDVVLEDQPIGGFDFEVTGESTPLDFGSHAIAPDDGKGGALKPVEAFKPTDRTMHLQVVTRGIDTTEPEVVWHLFKVAGGKDTELANTTQPKMKLQDSVFQCQFTSQKDWEKGDYRADIYMNGKKVHSIAFKVK